MYATMICRLCPFCTPRPSVVFHHFRRISLTSRKLRPLVLGIETSCDETGAAVVDNNGNVLGEGLYSQKNIHVRNGGIIPPLAQHLHRQHIDGVVQEALRTAGITIQDVSAVATTIMPGLALCLTVGLEYSKELVRKAGLPFIPIHHMEAHALTVRMIQQVHFPFLVLLVSGGHCILAVARGVGDFLVLGNTVDDAPGEAFDKATRRLHLHHHPECSGLSGGQAIEKMAAKGTDRTLFHQKDVGGFKERDCNFSFAGIKQILNQFITRQEVNEGIYDQQPPAFVSNLHDIAASFQQRLTQQITLKLIRAFEYCRQTELITQPQSALVVSGGVASNAYIRNALDIVCARHNYKLVCPPPHLCTDNGIMIAWAGMERFKLGLGFAEDPQNVRFEPRFPLGEDISEKVRDANIKVERIQFWKSEQTKKDRS
ncbi:tRNA N6-adenosine threonylcarbamoyltransferase, mitochondrial-like [Amphiura filiformis]|uniref:tRNA N6-adenosine threonylcarbamoyltransferase, mitochondrial-like n=1 Tax=Amphiura filiformis TaxID=82378 RepID=UPI003B21015B